MPRPHSTKIASHPRSTRVVSITHELWTEIFAPFHSINKIKCVAPRSLIKTNTRRPSRSGNPTDRDCLYPVCVEIWQLFINHSSKLPHWWSLDPQAAQLLQRGRLFGGRLWPSQSQSQLFMVILTAWDTLSSLIMKFEKKYRATQHWPNLLSISNTSKDTRCAWDELSFKSRLN